MPSRASPKDATPAKEPRIMREVIHGMRKHIDIVLAPLEDRSEYANSISVGIFASIKRAEKGLQK